MLRRIALPGLAALIALSALACHSGGKKTSGGPAVAKGDGFTITTEDFKARLEEQSPFVRARYTTLEKKKEFLDNLVRFEILAREAEKQGLRDDPEVQQTLKKIMVQKLVQRSFQTPEATKPIPDADVEKYFEEHKAEYFRPKRVRAALVAFTAAQGTPERAKKAAAARKALAELKVEEKKNPAAFTKIVADFSEDAATKATAGDLNFKTQEDLEKAYSKELAAAIFGLNQGETSGVIETPQGLYIARITAVQPEVNRTLDQVKPQISARLTREARSKEFDALVSKLKDAAKITVDDKALESVEVSAGGQGMPAGHPGMPGMPPRPPPPGAGPLPTVRPAPAPNATPAPPASK